MTRRSGTSSEDGDALAERRILVEIPGADPLAFTGQARLFRCFPGLFSFARSRMPMPLSMLLLVDEQIRMRNESARTIRLRSPFDAC